MPPWSSREGVYGGTTEAERYAVPDEGAVGLARPGPGRPALLQHGPGGLPGAGAGAEERTVPGPGEPVQRAERGDHLRPQRIQVEVADEFPEIWYKSIVVEEEPVLEQVAPR